MPGSKRFAPSRRRLEQARKDGDVAKSKDLTAVVTLTSGLCLIFFCGGVFALVGNLFTKTMLEIADFSTDSMLVYAANGLEALVFTTGPLLLGVAFATFVAESMQVGFRFSFKPLAIKFSRLAVGENLKRILGLDAPQDSSLPPTLVYEFFKGSILVTLYLIATFVVLAVSIPMLLAGTFDDIWQLIASGHLVSVRACALLLSVAALMGCIDIMVVRKRRGERLRMDTEEFKKELRESEGDPEFRGFRKQMHQELLLANIVRGVRRAKIVVADPG